MIRSVHALTVTELTRRIKALLEREDGLQSIWVRGEISNYKQHSSGHMYFTLKDDAAQIRCVMFKSRAQRLKFMPENGLAVLLNGSVSLYERDGQYQIYVDDIQPDGVGSLYKAFLQLKSRLEAEGLFDQALKRALPVLPKKVGVVTSLGGAAVRDIINVSKRRWPGVSLVLCDVLVQGEGSPDDIVRGLTLCSQVEGVDVIIVGRGGGSIEELWSFNTEVVARAIRYCPVPVVSAVGHETDYTIADFVADVRAPTPSAAAEIVIPDVTELCNRMRTHEARITSALRRSLAERRYALEIIAGRFVLRRGEDLVRQRRQTVDTLSRGLFDAAGDIMSDRRALIRVLSGQLDALSPLRILSRGYSICTRNDGRVLKQAQDVSAGEFVSVRLSRGQIECEVKSINPDKGNTGGSNG